MKIWPRLLSASLIGILAANVFAAHHHMPAKMHQTHRAEQPYLIDFAVSKDQSTIFGLNPYGSLVIKNINTDQSVEVNILNRQDDSDNWLYGLSVSPDEKKVYVVDYKKRVYVVDVEHTKLIGEVKGKPLADDMLGASTFSVSPDDNILYVFDGTPQQDGSVLLHSIDMSSDTIVSAIKRPMQDDESVVFFDVSSAIDMNHHKLYLTSTNRRPPLVFNLETHQFEGALGSEMAGLEAISLNLQQNQLYGVSFNDLYVTDLTTGQTKLINLLGKLILDVVASPDGKKIYIADADHNLVTVLSAVDYHWVSGIPITGRPQRFQVSGDKLYVSEAENYAVAEIDTIRDEVVKEIPLA